LSFELVSCLLIKSLQFLLVCISIRSCMKIIKILAFILVAVSLFACSGDSKVDSKVLRIGLKTEPPTLDPNLASDVESFKLLSNMFEGLTQFDLKLNVQPANAKSWKVTEDGMTYTFYLDPKYKWSDGKQVVAQEYVDGWVRLLDPKTASKYAYFLYNVKGAKEFNHGKNKDPNSVQVRAISDYEFQVTLTAPISYFPMITTFFVTVPIRKDLVDKDPYHFTNAKGYVSNGPFTLKEWRHDEKLTLIRNPYYGGKIKPEIERVEVYVIYDLVIQLALYQRDDLDFIELPPIAIKLFEDHPDFTPVPLLSTYYFGMNVTKPPLNQHRWRLALAMSLDKSKIPKVLRGGEYPTNSFVPKGMFGYEPDVGIKFDPQKARELIADDLKTGKTKKLTLNFNTDARNNRVAEWAQEEWKKNLGIEVELVNEEWKSYINRLDNNPPPLWRMGWGADYPDPDNFLNLFTSYSANNHTMWKSSEYDDLIKRASVITEKSERKKLYIEAQKLLLERETAIIPLFSYSRHYLTKRRIEPLPINPFEKVVFKLIRVK